MNAVTACTDVGVWRNARHQRLRNVALGQNRDNRRGRRRRRLPPARLRRALPREGIIRESVATHLSVGSSRDVCNPLFLLVSYRNEFIATLGLTHGGSQEDHD